MRKWTNEQLHKTSSHLLRILSPKPHWTRPESWPLSSPQIVWLMSPWGPTQGTWDAATQQQGKWQGMSWWEGQWHHTLVARTWNTGKKSRIMVMLNGEMEQLALEGRPDSLLNRIYRMALFSSQRVIWIVPFSNDRSWRMTDNVWTFQGHTQSIENFFFLN